MELYWIDDRLAVGPRPGASGPLDEALDAAREAGVDVLVSCLTEGEERMLGLLDEERMAVERGFHFERLRITDVEAPSDPEAFDRLVAKIVEARADGKTSDPLQDGMGRHRSRRRGARREAGRRRRLTLIASAAASGA